MSPSIAVAAWHEEHVYFNQLLSLLRKQVDVFHRGEQPNYELMQDIITYLREYSDRFHHPREDVAFARLAEHCPELDLVLARLRKEGIPFISILTDPTMGGVSASFALSSRIFSSASLRRSSAG